MGYPTVTNYDPHDGIRAVNHDSQSLHTNDTGSALTVKRATLLGKILSVIGTVTDGSNTGNGTCTALALGDGGPAKVGTYTLTCIVAGTTHGGTFKLKDPDGIDLATIIMPDTASGTYAYEGNGIAFTLTDAATNFIVGDSFTFTVTEGSGYYKQYSASAKDGSNSIKGISLNEVVHTANGNKSVGVMLQGTVDEDLIILHGNDPGDNITGAIKDELLLLGIRTVKYTDPSILDNQS